MPCEHSNRSLAVMSTINQPITSEVIWGARAIGQAIGRTEKAAFAMLEAGSLPGARKVAGRWAFNLKVFHAAFDEAAA
jgi:hypothetical protein